jgi:hypothetical protein
MLKKGLLAEDCPSDIPNSINQGYFCAYTVVKNKTPKISNRGGKSNENKQ